MVILMVIRILVASIAILVLLKLGLIQAIQSQEGFIVMAALRLERARWLQQMPRQPDESTSQDQQSVGHYGVVLQAFHLLQAMIMELLLYM